MDIKKFDEEMFITLSHGHSFSCFSQCYHKTSGGSLMGHSDDFMVTHHFKKEKINNRCYWCEILCKLKIQSYLGEKSLTLQKMYEKQPQNGSVFQFDLIFKLFMLLGFMNIAPLNE